MHYQDAEIVFTPYPDPLGNGDHKRNPNADRGVNDVKRQRQLCQHAAEPHWIILAHVSSPL